jgi:small subunit ribosomal protein S20
LLKSHVYGTIAHVFDQEKKLANIKSQIKRIRTAERQHERNKGGRSELKTRVSKFNKAVESGEKDVAKTTLNAAVKCLDKAVTKGFIHKNNAANKKSSLTKRFNKLG